MDLFTAYRTHLQHIQTVPEKDRLLEHGYGLPLQITPRTHKYTDRKELAWKELGKRGSDPFFVSFDESFYTWIVRKTPEDLENEATQSSSFNVHRSAPTPGPSNKPIASPSPGLYVNAHIGIPEDMNELPPPVPTAKAITEATQKPNQKSNKKPNQKQKPSKKASKKASKQSTKAAEPSGAHADVQSPLLDLAPSGGDGDAPRTPLRSQAQLYEFPLGLATVGAARPAQPECTHSPSDEAAAAHSPALWEEPGWSDVDPDTSAFAQRYSLESAQRTSDSAPASPTPKLSQKSKGPQAKSHASAVTQPYVLESAPIIGDGTAAASLPPAGKNVATVSSPKPSRKAGFTTVVPSPPLLHKLGAEPDDKTKDHSNRYHRAQECFTSALAKRPVLAENQTEFDSFFTRDAKKHGRGIALSNIERAAYLARCSPLWKREKMLSMMKELWK
jgi:hypothetical protein